MRRSQRFTLCGSRWAPVANEFWRKRWAEGRIGFHHPAPNPHLIRHLDRARTSAHDRVLLPLCGKSLDLVYLAERGHQVLGIELVETALITLFEEAERTFVRERVGPHTQLKSGRVRALAADIFDVRTQDVGPVDWAFDRAALIALPAKAQPRYASKLLELLGRGGRLLLTTIDYAEGVILGPPHRTPPTRVETLFVGRRIERLYEKEIIEEMPRFKARGLNSMVESVWLID